MISDSCNYLDELLRRYPPLLVCGDDIHEAFLLLKESFRNGNKLLICGNGGSAADAEHIVGELMKSFHFKRRIDPSFQELYYRVNGCFVPNWLEEALPAIALNSHTSLTTALSNDNDENSLFAQQVYGYGKKGDVLLSISTSGLSKNILEAIRVARAKEMCVIALMGENRTLMSELADVAICVPEHQTYKVQELHLPVYHCLCAMVEESLFGEKKNVS